MNRILTKADVKVGESVMIQRHVAWWGGIIGPVVAVYDNGVAVDTLRDEMPSIMFFEYNEVEK